MTNALIRVNVSLNEGEATALVGMADADCRHPREQLRHILREEARRRGLLRSDEVQRVDTNPKGAKRASK
jgi:hypothetical protein